MDFGENGANGVSVVIAVMKVGILGPENAITLRQQVGNIVLETMKKKRRVQIVPAQVRIWHDETI